MTEQIRVFLSYRRADTQHVAGRMADRIGDAFELFMDIDTIPPGVDFTSYVRRAVGSCDVLLAFIGPQWASLTDASGRRRLDDPQDWVVEEIRVALERGVRVIPVLVDEAALPVTDQLPESLRPLASRQALPLRHSSFSADAARLVAAVQSAGARRRADDAGPERPASEPFAEHWDQAAAQPATPVEVVLAEPARRSRRWIVPAAVVGALLVIAFLVVLIRPWGPGQGATAEPAQHSPEATAPAGSPVPSVRAARTVTDLRARLPADLRSSCQQLEPEPAVLRAALVVAVQCLPQRRAGTPAYIFYLSYADSRAALRAFRGYYAPDELGRSDCATAAGEHAYDRQGGRRATGTLRCYRDSQDAAVFAWTNDEQTIVASVADDHLTFSELKHWWESAGPLPPA